MSEKVNELEVIEATPPWISDLIEGFSRLVDSIHEMGEKIQRLLDLHQEKDNHTPKFL